MEIKQKFNRHIGRVLTFLDAGNVSPELKQLVKGELWTLYNDLIVMLEKEKSDDKSSTNKQ